LAFAALVMRCLEKRPADRPQNAHEIVRALDALMTSGTGVTAVHAKRRVSGVLVGAVASLLIVAAAGTWFAFNHRSRGAAAESRLLVAPFTNLTGNPAFDIAGRIAADQLTAIVAQAGAINVVDSRLVLQSLRDTTRPPTEAMQRLADATHARFLISGTVVLRGDSLQFKAQMTEVRTGKLVAALDPAMSPTSDPIVALNALGDRLLGALGVRRFAQLPQAGYRAPSYAALQPFAKGMDLFQLKGDFPAAIPFFKEAVSLDSTFTRAYLMLEQQYINIGELERADSVIQVVEHRSQRLSEAERLGHTFHKMEVVGDIPGRLQALQRLAAIDSSPVSLVLAGIAANDLLRPDLAVPAIEAGEAGYLAAGGWTRGQVFGPLLEAYHQAGMHDRELRAAIDLPAKYPDLDRARGAELRAYAGLRRRAPALALVDTMLREATESSGAVLASVGMAAREFQAHGDSATAAALLTRGREWIATHRAGALAPPRQFIEGTIFLGSGMADSAVVRFAAAASKSDDIRFIGYLALARAMIGDRTHAQATADSLGALSEPRLFGLNWVWQAGIVAALGDRATAVQLLKKARDGGQSMATWHYHGALAPLHGYPAFEALIRPKR
jgi:TolB-like protein/tetratricopeptide (TPR) repeat protein